MHKHPHSHHHHPHDHPHDHNHSHDPDHQHGHGHNSPPQGASQWQTPHLPHGAHDHGHGEAISDEQKDLDLVEKAFAEGFGAASDPTSFLRLANVPFTGKRADGTRLHLLRVEQHQGTDIGTVTPHLGGDSFRYAPLPARMTSRRDRLDFVYLAGDRIVTLTLTEAKALEADDTDAAGGH
ncbi:hypothetical protein [Nisaea sediminum]|uniref:hypothetical protein n=1 Tax=Nisaea sediminum TaxID=2775867 RepID=UPI0018696DCA|nr:hypothetical protein [Nisaea sediminum]